MFIDDCIAPIGLQARVLGYSLRPSVTETRLWLQASDLLLTLYHLFPLFPSPYAIIDTMVVYGDFLLLLQYPLIWVISKLFCHSLAVRSRMRLLS